MADIEVVSKRENQLLKRTEVTFRVTHPKEKTPQRGAVRDKIAAAVGGKKEGVIISYMRSRYGQPLSQGYAKVYESADAAKKMEPKHILIRHGLAEKVAKTAAAAPAKKEEKAPPAPAKK